MRCTSLIFLYPAPVTFIFHFNLRQSFDYESPVCNSAESNVQSGRKNSHRYPRVLGQASARTRLTISLRAPVHYSRDNEVRADQGAPSCPRDPARTPERLGSVVSAPAGCSAIAPKCLGRYHHHTRS